MVPCEFPKIFKNTFLMEHLRATTTDFYNMEN